MLMIHIGLHKLLWGDHNDPILEGSDSLVMVRGQKDQTRSFEKLTWKCASLVFSQLIETACIPALASNMVFCFPRRVRGVTTI
jgi:hypothetical protein